jgi:hypothetical protein
MSSIDKVIAISDFGNQELDKLMVELRAILADGIKHGFFGCEISVRTSKANRREVVITCGKSFKYTIRVDDLPR